jgi:acetyl-CoA carboxylase biotin carboxyl carrier protein
MATKKNASWLERVEELVHVLEGSSIAELELSEGDTEIIVRRQPAMVLVATSTEQVATGIASGSKGSAGDINNRGPKADKSVAVTAPLTGVYYAAASPTTPSFVNVGDIIHVGQVVALIEAMKVFNEIMAEVSGRVVALTATNGAVVQKGETLMRVEPL